MPRARRRCKRRSPAYSRPENRMYRGVLRFSLLSHYHIHNHPIHYLVDPSSIQCSVEDSRPSWILTIHSTRLLNPEPSVSSPATAGTASAARAPAAPLPRAADGLGAVAGALTRSSAAEDTAGLRVVLLTRRAAGTNVPWGMRLNPDTMQLRGCAPGSLAGRRGNSYGLGSSALRIVFLLIAVRL